MNLATEAAKTHAAVSAAELRRQRGYSVTDLAETCGLTESEIARIEAGEDVTIAYLKRVAAALRCPLTEMREYSRLSA